MILKRKKEHLPLEVRHERAKELLVQAKKQEKQDYIKIKVLNGYILVSPDKYARKKRYYHSLFGIENIIL